LTPTKPGDEVEQAVEEALGRVLTNGFGQRGNRIAIKRTLRGYPEADYGGWAESPLREILRSLAATVERVTREQDVNRVVDWAMERWKAEVENRPAVNVYRDILDGTWKQVMREAPKAIRSGGQVDAVKPR
jgi:hypothetical protein